MKVLGLITARGGSKSIPKKNIKELAGKPLIAYTIEAALGSKLLSRTILSTDSEEIASIAKSFGCEAPFLRPAEISGDTSTSLEAVQHALTWLKENDGEEYDYLLILQPTSPLRTAADIDACIQIAIDHPDADSVMGMKELEDFSPKKLKRLTKEGLLEPLLENEGTFTAMRQDAEDVYKRNAALYLTKTALLMEGKGDLFGSRSYAYVMPFDRSVDINSLADFDLAEFFLTKKK